MAAILSRSNNSGTMTAAPNRIKPVASLASLASNTQQSGAMKQLGAQQAYSATSSNNPLSADGTANPSYQPNTNLNAAQNANYNAEFANNDAMAGTIQDLGNRNQAAGERQAAYLASMSGGAGGYAQSGQIAANIAGQANTEQQLLANNQNRQAIYGQKANDLSGLQQGAQSYNNSVALAGQKRGYDLQDTASANGTAYAKSIIDQSNSRYSNLIKSSGHDSQFQKDFYGAQSALQAAIAAVPPGQDPSKDPKVIAAENALNNFDTSKYDKKGDLI
jgi:hypothetical protein